MKKNKKLKKELLLYKRQIVLQLNEYIKNGNNKDSLNNLIGDISVTNELISVLTKIKIMENAMLQTLEFPLGGEFVPFDIKKDYFGMCTYYDALLNETLKQRFNSKVLKNQLWNQK